jgi:hypothetical protein
VIRAAQAQPATDSNDSHSFRTDTESIDSSLATALLANGRFDEAISQARLAAAEFSKDSGRAGEIPLLTLIAAEYLNGDVANAKAQLHNFLATPRALTNLAAVKTVASLAANRSLLDGLRGAGMPEQ